MKQRNPLKQDPSQTAMIRRAWVADVNRRFAKLRRDTRNYILNDLGLIVNVWTDEERDKYKRFHSAGIVDNPNVKELRSLWKDTKRQNFGRSNDDGIVLRGVIHKKTGEHYWASAWGLTHESMVFKVGGSPSHYHELYLDESGGFTGKKKAKGVGVKLLTEKHKFPLTINEWTKEAEEARWAGHVKAEPGTAGGTGRELADKIVAAHGKHKQSKLSHIVEAPIHLEHKIKDLAIGAAKGAISHLQDVIKAGGAKALEESKGPSPFAAKLGKGTKMIATAGLKIAYAPWIAGQAAVERVALAKGLSKEAAAKVRTIATGYDLIGCKAVFLGLEHAGFPGLAAKSMFIPTASTLYLAHAMATNPIAVIKAAGKAIGDVKKMGVKGTTKAFGKWLVNAATSAIDKVVGVLADAMQRHEGDDWYFALLTQAMGEADSVPDAVKMAEKAYDQQPAPTTNAPFVFETDDKKLKRFRRWFQQQVDAGILEANPMSGEPKGMKPWMHKYVDSAYRKGLVRSYLSTHTPDLTKKMPYSEGSKEEFLRSSFGRPERVSKLQMLYTRTYEDLKGVTAAMSTQMSRTLADGMSHGFGPMKIARNLTKTVDDMTVRRARVIARTETIHAHAEGSLDGLEDLGVKVVEAEVEWSTAGDDGVCPKCAKLEGKLFTIKAAHGLIPLHPNCRCTWLPYVRSAALGNLKKGK